MRYLSLGKEGPPVTLKEATLSGVAPDGGLYVPESIPALPSTLSNSLHQVAVEALQPFVDEVRGKEFSSMVQRVFSFPIPLVKLKDRTFLLELFHGPTLSFKDAGARFLAAMLEHFMRNEGRSLTILVATSGDTGGAVAHAFHGTRGVDVCILYPSGRISEIQERQITTLGGNVYAIEVDGTFDDCQTLVKESLRHPQWKGRVTSANSINIGRLLPQIVYYVWAWRQLRDLADETRPRFVVPVGNLGNLTAALYAHSMGVPASGFAAAANANAFVPQYLLTGKAIPRPAISTLSPAMDVGDPGNLPRLLHLAGNSHNALRELVQAESVDDEETTEEIRQTFGGTGYVLDPHTAVAVRAARRLCKPDKTVIIASTAHPAKFRETIEKALGEKIPLPISLERVFDRQKESVRIRSRDEWMKWLREKQAP